MKDKYREEGVQGELCRLLVQPPCRFYRLEKSVDGAPPRRIYQSHKPRVSLRCYIYHNKEALNQGFGSGSARILMFLPCLDPDQHKFLDPDPQKNADPKP